MNGGEAEAKLNPLERLAALLGDDVFFVPCEWGNGSALS